MTAKTQTTVDSRDEYIAQLEAQLAAAKKSPKIAFKVTQKGGISVYGLQRFPVTLYKDQWTKLLGMKDDLEKFITDNAASLAVKA